MNTLQRIVTIAYFDKKTEFLITLVPIKNCTLKDIDKILKYFYPN